jgi:hypothetical protein
MELWRIRGGFSGYSSSAGSPPSLRRSLRARRRALSYLVPCWASRSAFSTVGRPPVQTRAHEPPSQPAEMRAGGGEINLVVNLDFLATPIIRHRIFQAQPALPRVAQVGFEFHVDLVAVEIEPHFAGETSKGAKPSPLHHVINVEP